MKKAGPVFLLVFLVSAVGAVPASLHSIDEVAGPESPANYSLRISNNLSTTESFRASASGTNPSWYYIGNAITLEPGENGTIPVHVTPDRNAVQGNYRFDIYLHMLGTDKYRRFNAFYRVNQPFDLQVYSASLEPGTVNPGEELGLDLKIRNLASQTVDNYRIRVEYPGGEKNQTSSPITPSGERGFSFQIRPDDSSPGQKTVKVEIYREGKLQQSFEKHFRVAERSRLNRTVSEDDRVLTYTRTFQMENTGNVEMNATLNESLSGYLSPITAFSKEPDRRESGGGTDTYYWDESLSPGETVKVSYTTNYWIPLAAVIVLLGGMIAIKRLRGSVEFEKDIEKVEDGLKISLMLSNPSDRTYTDLKVKDFVPDVATVSEEFEMARPVMRKTSEGTELTWDVDELRPGEQRVLQYVIRPKVEVEEGISLKGAELVGEGGKISDTGGVESEFRPQ